MIAPGSDHAVAIAARAAGRLGLAHPISPETGSLAVSRLRQRERLEAAGVPQPRSVVCRSLAEVTRAADELGYPVVVEAPDRTGERGVGACAQPSGGSPRRRPTRSRSREASTASSRSSSARRA